MIRSTAILLLLAGAAPAISQGSLVVLDEHVLRPSPAAKRDQFGHCVALEPGRLAVGAPQRDVQVSTSGIGFVVLYVPGPGGWQEEARLEPGDGAQGDRFGAAVALEGDTLLVGAPGHDPCAPCTDRGAVYVFERVAGVWTETQKLVRASGVDHDELGTAVALEGDTAVFGAPGGDGYAVRFRRNAGTWTEVEDWIQTGGPDFSQLYGSALALDGELAVVGAPGLDSASYDSGAGFVWRSGGGSWAEEDRLEPSGAATLTYAGRAVALSGDVVVLGATSPFTSGPGAAWAFHHAGGSWTEEAELAGADSVEGDDFGAAVELLDSLLAVGAPGRDDEAGAVYLFERSPSGWAEVARIEADLASTGRRLGSSTALAPGLVAAGAAGDDLLATDAGAVHVFEVAPAFQSYCVATLNSTGLQAAIGASGSNAIAANDLVLEAWNMPAEQFGYFIASQDQGFVPFPGGSQGNLCLGGQIVRFNGLARSTGATGELDVTPDLTAFPSPYGGPVLPGQTWSFQAWFRDKNPTSTSNFTDGLAVTFTE